MYRSRLSTELGVVSTVEVEMGRGRGYGTRLPAFAAVTTAAQRTS